jgi:hypothetical protein
MVNDNMKMQAAGIMKLMESVKATAPGFSPSGSLGHNLDVRA